MDVRRLKDVLVREESVGAKMSARTAVAFPRFCRAGFEPRRGRPAALRFEAADQRYPWRCNPHAWLKSGAVTIVGVATARRAEISAPRVLAPRCVAL